MKKCLLILLLCVSYMLCYGQNKGVLMGPKTIYVGDVVTYGTFSDKDFDKTVWTYNSAHFEYVDQTIYQFEEYRILRAKAATSATTIHVKVRQKNNRPNAENDHDDELVVVIKPVPNFTIKSLSPECIACNNNEVSFKIEGVVPEGSKITWTPLTNLTYISGQNTTVGKFKATGSGYSKVRVDIEYVGRKFTQENSEVWVGPPSSIDYSIDGWIYTSPQKQYTYRIPIKAGVSVSGWSVGSPLTLISTSANSAVISTPAITTNVQFKKAAVKANVTNKCGVTPVSMMVYVENPDYIGLPIKENSMSLKQIQELKSVKIYDLSGVLVHSDNTVNGSFDIKSTVLSDGIYIIEKFDGENRTSEKVILKR